MAGAQLEPAFTFLMELEGGGVTHTVAGDPGGTTKWGISQRSHPNENIDALTREQAIEIYRHAYWEPMRLPQVNNQTMANEIFEFGVNAGRRVGVRTAQQAVNDVFRVQKHPGITEDGLIGPQTLGALNRIAADPLAVLAWAGRFNLRQLRFYRQLRRDLVDRFFLGWTRRVIGD